MCTAVRTEIGWWEERRLILSVESSGEAKLRPHPNQQVGMVYCMVWYCIVYSFHLCSILAGYWENIHSEVWCLIKNIEIRLSLANLQYWDHEHWPNIMLRLHHNIPLHICFQLNGIKLYHDGAGHFTVTYIYMYIKLKLNTKAWCLAITIGGMRACNQQW